MALNSIRSLPYTEWSTKVSVVYSDWQQQLPSEVFHITCCVVLLGGDSHGVNVGLSACQADNPSLSHGPIPYEQIHIDPLCDSKSSPLAFQQAKRVTSQKPLADPAWLSSLPF